MRRLKLALLVPALGLLTIDPAFAAKKATNAPLVKLFETTWQEDLADDPVGATALGDTRYNDKWPDLTQLAIDARQKKNYARLQSLAQDQSRQAREGRPAQLRPVPARDQAAHR